MSEKNKLLTLPAGKFSENAGVWCGYISGLTNPDQIRSAIAAAPAHFRERCRIHANSIRQLRKIK